MLRLTPQTESRWIDLPRFGARIRIRPLSTAVMAAARGEASKRVAMLWREAEAQEQAGFPPDPTGPSFANPIWRDGVVRQYFAAALLRYAAEAWEGVADQDGNPLLLDAVAAEAFAAHDEAASAFLDAALAPIEALAAEGNASAPSSPGAGDEGANTVPAAGTADARTARLN